MGFTNEYRVMEFTAPIQSALNSSLRSGSIDSSFSLYAFFTHIPFASHPIVMKPSLSSPMITSQDLPKSQIFSFTRS